MRAGNLSLPAASLYLSDRAVWLAGRQPGPSRRPNPPKPRPIRRPANLPKPPMFLIGAIIVEVTGRMVLLIPKAWNRAKDIGRAEGRAEGLAEGLTVGQAAERDRVQAILSQYARRDPQTGRLILDLDQDAEERLLNGKG